MFTGIIQASGKVSSIRPMSGDIILTVSSTRLDLSTTQIGDSIAVNGACLTVCRLGTQEFSADVSRETLAHTTLAKLRIGQAVNLEKALLPTTPLGGHFVSGHIDGVGTLTRKNNDGRSLVLEFTLPSELMRYVAVKGSIAIDGTSLTINTVSANSFSVNLIPQTQSETTLTALQTGDKVNIEVDLIARYLERLMLKTTVSATTPESSLTIEKLMSYGFPVR